jgi:23S rRNA maturation mini-RNase III
MPFITPKTNCDFQELKNSTDLENGHGYCAMCVKMGKLGEIIREKIIPRYRFFRS